MDEKLAVGTTQRVQFELDMVSSDGNSTAVRTLSFDNPDTSQGGISAIAAFKEWLLGGATSPEMPAVIPKYAFQPNDFVYGGSTTYGTVSVAAKIITTTVTEV